MKQPAINFKKGFTLVELLIVIAVIGVIAAIAIPALSSIFEESKKAKNQRNAQQITSMFQAAISSGVTAGTGIPLPGINTASKASIIDALEAGVTVADPSSPLVGKRFSIGTLAGATQTETLPYLKRTGDQLDYIVSGNDSGT